MQRNFAIRKHVLNYTTEKYVNINVLFQYKHQKNLHLNFIIAFNMESEILSYDRKLHQYYFYLLITTQ